MYCAWRIPAHLRCTQCSILLHLMDICFLTCICLWQISQIQTFLFKVVGPGLVSTSPAFGSSSASHPAGPHGRHAQKTVNRAPNASETNIDKLQIVQNTALRIATGCTHDTNTQHLHDETNVLPIHQHLQLHASQIRQKAQHPTHPLHKLTIHPHTPRLKKQTTFNNTNYTTNIDTHPDTVTQQQISVNSTQIHTNIVQSHLMQRNHNKLIHQHAPKISPSELSLPRETRRTLTQLRTNKSPILISYLHKVDETHHPSTLCPLCKTHPHTIDHIFNCTHLYTSSNILDLWISPERVAPLLVRWRRRLAGLL